MAPLRACCVTGHISEGTPTGEYIKIGGVDAYLAKPEEPTKHAVIMATDVFGYKLPNAQLIADAFAQQGFYTVIPDMFNGGPLPAWMMDALPKISGIPGSPDGQPSFFTKFSSILTIAPSALWFMFQNPAGKKVPILEETVKELKAKHGITKVGMVGYCYGGGPILMIAKKEGIIDTFVVAHTQISVPADITQNKVPGLIQAAEADFAFSDKAREQAQEIVKKENLGDKIRIKYFPGTFHGFAVRGDDKVELIKKAKQEAFDDAVQWFNERFV